MMIQALSDLVAATFQKTIDRSTPSRGPTPARKHRRPPGRPHAVARGGLVAHFAQMDGVAERRAEQRYHQTRRARRRGEKARRERVASLRKVQP